jgi:hypothetical protein
MTDFRALCAELHAAFNTYAVNEAHHDLLARAKAAMAQPEPQGPTDKELLELFNQFDIEGAADETKGMPLDVFWDDYQPQEIIKFARAVLDRWGGSAPCPYVVSSDEGTSYCRLAEHTADQLAKLLGEGGG